MAGMYPSSDPSPIQVRCWVCGGDDIEDADDGFFYCRMCGSRVEDIIDTGVADEDFVDKTGGLSHGGGALYLASHKRKVHAAPTPTPLSLVMKSEDGGGNAVGPTEPADFGSAWRGAVAREEDYCKVIRRRYVIGVQMMFQLQCEALVEKFNVNPLICGIAASVWLRFVASTRVYDDGWADRAVVESESQGEKTVEGRKRYYGKILPYACRIYEWSMPPELWLSANESKLPTRVYVMSILIVAIRILYNINGFGKWEKSLSAPNESSSVDNHAASSDPACESSANDDAKEGPTCMDMDGELEENLASVHKFESEAAELLHILEKRYNEMNARHEYSKDLPTYLQYCRDVVFAGSCEGDEKEAGLIEKLWDFYQKNCEDVETSLKLESGPNQKRENDGDELFNIAPMQGTICSSADGSFLSRDASPEQPPTGDDELRNSQADQIPEATSQGEASNQNLRDTAIRRLKIDMEEHRFCYIPPRENVKSHDYLLYMRKRNDGSLAYTAHADYYIILRACAKAAQVDVRVMHIGVLHIEKRLHWIEKKIDDCLQEICTNVPDISDSDAPGEPVNISNQNL